MAPLTIAPPLLNSANPWCTTLAQLRELYASPHTGAVTTRTSLLNGFPHDPSHHQFTFFDPRTLAASQPNASTSTATQTASLNTLGYSPHPLSDYLSFISAISRELPPSPSPTPSSSPKPFIISVTGPVADIIKCYTLITALQPCVPMRLAMELNLSCPNIPGAPPPAYDAASLSTYLEALKRAVATTPPSQAHGPVPIGIKTPPYTHHAQYEALLRALRGSLAAEPAGAPCPVDFITATNTLGSALVVSPGGGEGFEPTLESAAGTGIGGLAGAPLHALALGNVVTIRGMLDQHAELARIQIIGVGGVEDVDGYRRMRAVGAAAVGVGTALGRRGMKVFEDIDGALRARL
jgi:dihydroorotate dehydrogenase (fumarate)